MGSLSKGGCQANIVTYPAQSWFLINRSSVTSEVAMSKCQLLKYWEYQSINVFYPLQPMVSWLSVKLLVIFACFGLIIVASLLIYGIWPDLPCTWSYALPTKYILRVQVIQFIVAILTVLEFWESIDNWLRHEWLLLGCAVLAPKVRPLGCDP